MELSGKCVVVVGLGRSGVAAAQLCRARGARVVATDTTPLGELSAAARALDAELVAGTHDGVPFATADLVVVSPGVPAFPELERAAADGVEVVGELELATRLVRAPILCVGGTNGKSTTTVLVGQMLEAAYEHVFVGGNLGTPLAEAVDRAWDWIVLEVSSFQLERAPQLHPRVSVLLNVTDDHLDRYVDGAAYAHAKGNAFVNQTSTDHAIVPHGDRICLKQATRGAGRLHTFGPGGDFDVRGREIVELEGERYSLAESGLLGAHNALNAAAAAAAARAAGAPPEAVRAGIAAFRPLPHRMALVAEVDGVRFYDDSKGTNVGAAVTALRGLAEDRAVLIAGGRDKLGAYDDLVAALEAKGRAAVLIGEAAERIAAAIAGRVPVVRASDMDTAVARAAELARPGDAVLLSPACASFDMFKSYADRGDRFAAAVRSVAAARGNPGRRGS